jgi:hypothetical protein
MLLTFFNLLEEEYLRGIKKKVERYSRGKSYR